MTEQKMTGAVMPPVTMTVIGTGDGFIEGTKVTTPPDQPNIVIKIVTPIMAIAVRFVFTFGGQIVGLLTAAMTPQGSKILYTSDFWTLLLTCASLSLPWTMLALFKDIVTVFKGLEGKYPLLTGSV